MAASTIQNDGLCIVQTEAEINIDPEIQSLIPSLKPNELAKLRDSILAEGCRDPLVVWKDHGLLLDGHNRLAICEELGKPYSVLELDFPDKDHAMLWILKNHLGRRNLSDTQFKLMVGMEYELEKKVSWGGDRKSETIKENQLPQSEGDDSLRETAERLAKEHNISRSTVERSADLYKAHKVIQEVAPEIAKKLESEEIKAPKKDIRTLGKVLKQGTPEQKEQIVSELKNDPEKAIDMAKEIEAQSKPENLSPEPEVSTTRSDSDLDFFLMLADRMCCPKCGKNTRLVLRLSCCSLSLDEAADLVERVKNEHICPADSPDTQVEEPRFENEEPAGTVTVECLQKEPKSNSEMASWVPADNSSLTTSKILGAFCNLLKRGEAPRIDSLAKMACLSAEEVLAYVESAPWVRKKVSPDGIAEYLPIEPSRTGFQAEVDNG